LFRRHVAFGSSILETDVDLITRAAKVSDTAHWRFQVIDKDVVRFHIAMNKPVIMQELITREYLAEELDSIVMVNALKIERSKPPCLAKRWIVFRLSGVQSCRNSSPDCLR
jgi:DNA gyrase/topoisomerase IV subunit A